jgi:uncharacterized protein (TIGR03435 family)
MIQKLLADRFQLKLHTEIRALRRNSTGPAF